MGSFAPKARAKDNRKAAGAFGWQAKVPSYIFARPICFT